jgi:hypothetical protein
MRRVGEPQGVGFRWSDAQRVLRCMRWMVAPAEVVFDCLAFLLESAGLQVGSAHQQERCGFPGVQCERACLCLRH